MGTTDVAPHEEIRGAAAEADALITSLGRLSVAGGADGGAASSLQRRIREQVVRPLRAAVDRFADASSDGTADPAAPRAEATPDDGDTEARLWALAQLVAGFVAAGGRPFELVLAAATLEDIASRRGLDPGAELDPGRVAALRALHEGLAPGIVPVSNGPLVATNVRNFSTWLGEPIGATPLLSLCRCGGSALKPRCDASCTENGFTDAKDPKRVPDNVDEYPGRDLLLSDNRGTCAHSGFCSDRLPSAFRVHTEPFVNPGGGRMDELIHVVRACPSGALGVALAAGPSVTDTERDASVEVSRNGPYRVTGGIALRDEHGEPVPRNQAASLEHYSLCRCGHSRNKPFCSGMHWYVGFVDPPLSSAPTVFEWAGGFPAMRRLTRVFYERYIPEDDLLSPLAGTLDPQHADRAAMWYAEVFGGPRRYSDQYGAAPPAGSIGGGAAHEPFSEPQRERWVELMERAADFATLPPDPEFRSTLSAFFDWTSRVSAESRPGAEPICQRPVPSWGWGPAGAPHVATAVDDGARDVVIPDAASPVSFADHVKALFREKDRASMLFAFDLRSYEDVAANAGSILERLEAGTMPCDGSWTPERIDVFRRWIAGGKRADASSPVTPPATVAEADNAKAPAPSEAITGRLGSVVRLRSTQRLEEPSIVIEHREQLIYMLCAAAELEHALMCEYLFAAFSLKRDASEGLTDDQVAAVQRWRAAILAVAKQEMLHLAINCNLVTSLGASPHLSRPNLPQPARHYPAGVRLEMLPFGEQALRHFLFLERPEGMDMDDAEGIAADDFALPLVREDEIAPHQQEFQTVGHLYRSIEAGFRHLAEKLGEENLFLGPRDAQAAGELFGWKELAQISTVDDAMRAIEAIVEQGEGPRGDWRNAHFGRFLRVLTEYLDMMNTDPDVVVTRPVLPVLVREPESGQRVDLITDLVTARVADLGNVAYEVLLQLLYRLLCHVDESDQQIKTLADVGVQMMFDVIEPLADILTTMPVGPEHPGRTAGPTFELFYQPDYLLPHRRAAWLLMAEHLADAAVLADGEAARDARFLPVAASLRAHAATLRAGAD